MYWPNNDEFWLIFIIIGIYFLPQWCLKINRLYYQRRLGLIQYPMLSYYCFHLLLLSFIIIIIIIAIYYYLFYFLFHFFYFIFSVCQQLILFEPPLMVAFP